MVHTDDLSVGAAGVHDPSSRLGLIPAGDIHTVREMARGLIGARDVDALARAEEMLASIAPLDDPTGETHHLLGLALFLQQKYGPAKKSFELAVAADPGNAEWRTLLERATRNEISRLADGIEPTAIFDQQSIARPPVLSLREPIDIKPLPPGPSRVVAPYIKLRDIVGRVPELFLDLVLRYESRHGIPRTWTECFAIPDGLTRAFKLGAIRNWMNRYTLQSAEPVGELVGHQAPGQKRPAWTERFRTANGSWTTDDPAEGAAGARFIWQGVAPMSDIRVNRAEDGTLPSVREVSRAFLHREDERAKAPFLNPLAIWWIQFQLHDWLNHRQVPLSPTDRYRVPLAPDDPFRARYGLEELTFRKTQPDPTNKRAAEVYQNEVTAWWDGSQIYGSDQQTQDLLRTDPRRPGQFLPDGKMYLDDGGILPLDARGRELSGFTRNWSIGLSALHAVFVREHNCVCDLLKKNHPGWSTDQLFHTARLVNAAVMAKIHTVEWTPAVLPTRALVIGMNTNWNGLFDAMCRKFKDRKALNEFDVTNPVLGGFVGGKRNNHGVPHGFSEQFSEVYRLHAGVPDHLEYRRVSNDRVVELIPIDQLREQGAASFMRKAGLVDVINSLGNGYMPALVNNNLPAFMTDMSVEGMPVTDLGAADILRCRERGVPQYNEFRRQLGMAEITRFEDLKCDPKVVAKLKTLYGVGRDGVEKMDLTVGMLCDRDLPLAGFDNVRFAIFLQMASRRLEADPFFCEKFSAQYYTQEGIDHVDGADLKGVLLRQCPALASTGLATVNNAFEPWNTTAAEAPHEHPLTAFAERY